MRNDEIKVLNIMEQHAKENINEIAKKCGLSPQKVTRIIKNLEKEKIIWGYSAIADGTLRDFKHFVVLAKRNTVPFGDEVRKEIILRKLDDYPMHIVKIENIYLTHGVSDWILTFYAPDLVSAKKFVEETFARFDKYLQEYTLIETLVTVRKHGLKNPRIKELVEYA
jgi:DNA-binding Lrp family transcriptional regulator